MKREESMGLKPRFEDVLRKFMKFSWEVEPNGGGGTSLHREITQSLQEEAELSPAFIKQPPDGLLQAIALPTYLYLRKTVDPSLSRRKDRNPLYNNLSEKEIEAVDRFYHLDTRFHREVLHLASDETQIPILTSYLAANFAYCTLKVPAVIPLERLVQEVDASTFDETLGYEYCRSCAILIVTRALGNSKRLVTVDGDLCGLLDRRSRYHKMTVFIDAVSERDVSDTLDSGKLVSRDMVRGMIDRSGVGSTYSYKRRLKSMGTYMNFNIKRPMEGVNEWSRDRVFV